MDDCRQLNGWVKCLESILIRPNLTIFFRGVSVRRKTYARGLIQQLPSGPLPHSHPIIRCVSKIWTIYGLGGLAKPIPDKSRRRFSSRSVRTAIPAGPPVSIIASPLGHRYHSLELRLGLQSNRDTLGPRRSIRIDHTIRLS